MHLHRFGPSSFELPVIGQGTWMIDEGDRASVVAALRRGIELGMNHIDTAEMYGDAELLVAEAIDGRRDEVFLVSKVLPQNASRKGTIAACDRSLSRLRTDRLDCYLLHWRGGQPLEETFAAFEQLNRDGKILSWGVSNFDVPDLDEALALVGESHIACNQVLYHLQERAIEYAVIPWCEAHGVAVVAYSPFGHGHFPGTSIKVGRVLSEIAKAHGADSAPGGVAVPGAAPLAVRDPQGLQLRARGRKRRGRRPHADRRRVRANRCRLPPRPPPSWATDAVRCNTYPDFTLPRYVPPSRRPSAS